MIASTTVAPLTRLPPPSRAVTVMVDWFAPFEAVMVEGATRIVDWVGLTGPERADAVNTAGAGPPTAACAVCGPLCDPSFQVVAAIPFASV